MAQLTKEAIDAIMPILKKDAEARKALRLYLDGKSNVEGTGPTVRRQVSRMVEDRFSSLTRTEREQLLLFAARYPPGAWTAKGEEPLTERITFRTSTSQKALVLQVAKLNKLDYGEWVRRVVVAAAEREAREHGISGTENTAVGD